MSVKVPQQDILHLVLSLPVSPSTIPALGSFQPLPVPALLPRKLQQRRQDSGIFATFRKPPYLAWSMALMTRFTLQKCCQSGCGFLYSWGLSIRWKVNSYSSRTWVLPTAAILQWNYGCRITSRSFRNSSPWSDGKQQNSRPLLSSSTVPASCFSGFPMHL